MADSHDVAKLRRVAIHPDLSQRDQERLRALLTEADRHRQRYSQGRYRIDDEVDDVSVLRAARRSAPISRSRLIGQLARRAIKAEGAISDENFLAANRDRYVVGRDMDSPARSLLARAQEAIDVIMESEVNRAGLLDAIHNRVLLPAAEWELAIALRGLGKLRSQHSGSEAYARAATELTDRVCALERYADHARQSDATLLLAGGDRDRAQLDDLIAQAHQVERLLG